MQKVAGATDASVAHTGEHIQVTGQMGARQLLSPMRLIVGCTDGQVAIFDALSLARICSFDAV